MRFALVHPSETRPALIVETCARCDETAIARLREVLFGQRCPNGLLFDDEWCVILRDSYASMAPASIEVDDKVPTRTVLGQVRESGSLDTRVKTWLELLAEQWDAALPSAPSDAAPFIADIVPAASGSLIYPITLKATA